MNSIKDVTVQRVGFITDDNRTVGCSPDRLVGDDGLLEIKAPLPQTQVEYWISGEIHERFRPQLQGQLCVSQRSWVDIVCWHDVLPKVVMRVEPDEQFIKTLDHELQIFNFFIERIMEKIRATNEAPVPQGRLALRAALRASLETVPWRYARTSRVQLSRMLAKSSEFAQHDPINFTLRLTADALANPKTDALPPHPPHRSARQAQA
jgi:hypothetical protein